MLKDAAYWISLAHLPKWRTARTNELIIKFHHTDKISIEEFFFLERSVWEKEYGLSEKEIEDIANAKADIPNNSFLAETLENQGFELIPITSEDYSKTLKDNLKVNYSPPLLYIKGDKQIFTEKSIAVVGSRTASAKSLQFTDNIAKLASKEFKVIVSGFAKGVDKQALDSSIKHIGRSIIVLPQGVLTFGKGYQEYYRQIVNGEVVVLSTFHPNAPWMVELAMARNPIIYGLASEIYVAESDEKGGTWSGVKDGLRKERKIYVRMADADEKNANGKLIEMGAIPVDFDGKVVEESAVVKENRESFEDSLRKIIAEDILSAKEISSRINSDWTSRKVADYLKKLDWVEEVKIKSTTKFRLKTVDGSEQVGLF
jgi:predicted Rossmann fold nucleotide-binding protein DprA/Smf involved in DNA uptake